MPLKEMLKNAITAPVRVEEAALDLMVDYVPAGFPADISASDQSQPSHTFDPMNGTFNPWPMPLNVRMQCKGIEVQGRCRVTRFKPTPDDIAKNTTWRIGLVQLMTSCKEYSLYQYGAGAVSEDMIAVFTHPGLPHLDSNNQVADHPFYWNASQDSENNQRAAWTDVTLVGAYDPYFWDAPSMEEWPYQDDANNIRGLLTRIRKRAEFTVMLMLEKRWTGNTGPKIEYTVLAQKGWSTEMECKRLWGKGVAGLYVHQANGWQIKRHRSQTFGLLLPTSTTLPTTNANVNGVGAQRKQGEGTICRRIKRFNEWPSW